MPILNIEIAKDNVLFPALIKEYPSAEIIEISSFNANDLASVLIPITAILAPVVSPIIQKLLADRKVSIKYGNIEISGDCKQASKILKELLEEENNKKGL